MTERDLELVLLTGAGASCPFGMDGTPLPLMADWSEHVMRKFRSSNEALIRASGLEEGLGGNQFEERLGGFLRAVAAFEQIKPLLEPSLDFPSVPVTIRSEGVLADWHSYVSLQWKQAVGLIHASLYELFGDPRVDIKAAVTAYRNLLGQLAIGRDSRWVFATTNYDTIGERVIAGLGGQPPDWGELAPLDGTAERTVNVRNLVDGVGRYVPVLHLHGRIGWHRRSVEQGGYVYASLTKTWSDGIGAPIVMLPDPKKLYDEHDFILELWQQFKAALTRAQRVVVLGHSLNDPAIVEALRSVEPRRVLVFVLGQQNDPEPDPTAQPVVQIARDQLPGVTTIPLIFGQPASAQTTTALARWHASVARLDTP